MQQCGKAKYRVGNWYVVNRSAHDSKTRTRKGRSRYRALVMAVTLAIVGIVSGVAGLVASFEPGNSSYATDPAPWLLLLGPARLGVEFINYGWDNSAVFFGVADTSGNWLHRPVPVTPLGTYNRAPTGAIARIDETGRVHIAWALFETDRELQSYYYLQLDPSGFVRVESKRLGTDAVREVYIPVPIGLHISPNSERVAWFANGTYNVVTLGSDGNVISGPEPTPTLDNASYFPVRGPPPGGIEPVDQEASSVSDSSGNVYYLWRRTRQWYEGRNFRLEQDLQFLKEGPSGSYSKVLHSTEDSWWLTKPFVLPSSIVLVSGSLIAPILTRLMFRLRQREGGAL